MQIVSQETFLQAEREGNQFLDHQFAMIQCINDWRIKIFNNFNLNMNNYMTRLQLDIQIIKNQLINPENSNKVNFTLGQIGLMDILRMNFKSCQKRLKQFLIENKDNLSFNLVSDLMKNTQTLREYFSYDKNYESFYQQPFSEHQQYEDHNIDQHSEEEIQLDFNQEENCINNNSAKSISQEDNLNDEIFDNNMNEIQLDFDECCSNNDSNRNSLEQFNNIFQQEYQQQYNNQQNQFACNTNSYPQLIILE